MPTNATVPEQEATFLSSAMQRAMRLRHELLGATRVRVTTAGREATGQAAAELAGSDLESQFAALESGSDVDDDLAALRAQLKAGPEAVALPSADSSADVKPVKVEEVDADLEDLKRSIDKL